MSDAPRPRPGSPGSRLLELGGARRLAVALFLLLLLAFYGLAQVQLAFAVNDGKPLPGPDRTLAKYHGDPAKSRLHLALDPGRSGVAAMYANLGSDEATRAARREEILRWVDGGAPRDGWPAVAPVFNDDATCGLCHSEKPLADQPRTMARLPFDTYEQVLAVTRPGAPMSIAALAETSHNHMAGFATLALLSSLAFTASRWRGAIATLLVLGAFGGAALDVASWWLTRAYGAPWHYAVMLGGGLFGASVTTMVLLSLDEVVLGGRVADRVAPLLARLRLGRLEAS
jgi:hypothetical protein